MLYAKNLLKSIGLKVELPMMLEIDKKGPFDLINSSNCYNQFVFGQHVMTTLTKSGYVWEELFSQTGNKAEDAKFDKTLMADLSRQARQPMTVISVNAAYCYDRVNHEIISLVWLVLLNGNVPATIAALICLQPIKNFQHTGCGKSKTFFGGPNFPPYMMGLSQGNRAVPPSWIQLCLVMVNVFKKFEEGQL
jgi:hypothetical protein